MTVLPLSEGNISHTTSFILFHTYLRKQKRHPVSRSSGAFNGNFMTYIKVSSP
ncbi:hypothetical protein [Paenibacillus durus]|uniref:hypothetical protein n=1 Tax=Paenibacillus durus TaxID=44251 RepID=UPI000AC10465|nr:hypothetical protein [Paenibacillus durus]